MKKYSVKNKRLGAIVGQVNEDQKAELEVQPHSKGKFIFTEIVVANKVDLPTAAKAKQPKKEQSQDKK